MSSLMALIAIHAPPGIKRGFSWTINCINVLCSFKWEITSFYIKVKVTWGIKTKNMNNNDFLKCSVFI